MNRFLPVSHFDREIVKFVDLWIEDGYKSYDDLELGLKEKLTTLYIKQLGTDCYDAIIEPEDFTQTIHHLLKYIETGKREYAFDLAETMSKNAIDYFSKDLSHLFEDRLEEKTGNRKLDAGLYPHKDKVTGETIWI